METSGGPGYAAHGKVLPVGGLVVDEVGQPLEVLEVSREPDSQHEAQQGQVFRAAMIQSGRRCRDLLSLTGFARIIDRPHSPSAALANGWRRMAKRINVISRSEYKRQPELPGLFCGTDSRQS